jgi:hypothetical protein
MKKGQLNIDSELKGFSNKDINKLRDAVYKISDAYHMLQEIDNTKAHSGDLNKLIFDLAEIGAFPKNGGPLAYFLGVL